jgi:hypothetical protein
MALMNKILAASSGIKVLRSELLGIHSQEMIKMLPVMYNPK